MARAKKPDRFICIEDRKRGVLRFRVHFVRAGKRVARGVGTAKEAEDLKRQVLDATAHLQTISVAKAVEQHITEMTGRKWRENAKQYPTKVSMVRRFFAPVGELPVGALTAAHMTRCCLAWDTPERSSQGTRHQGRVRAYAFFAWAVKARLLKASPMGEDHYVARPRGQKGRLRLDDARRLRAVVDPAALAGDQSAAFVLTSLLLGARSSEVTGLTAASFDDGGRVVSYVDAKDPEVIHEVRMPAILSTVLGQLARRAGDGLLMKPCGHDPKAWGARAVRHWAKVAGLSKWEEMDARWLRRTKDTLAVEAGVSAEVVARETGHTLHVARQSYIGRGAETTGRAAAMDEATGTVCQAFRTGAANDS